MRTLVMVCLAVVVAVSAVAPMRSAHGSPARLTEESPFELARRIGEPSVRCFHLFSTSVGNYTIRHDGMGEVYVRGRKKVFHLKAGARARIEWVYFYEYEGDLLLLYQTGGSGYLVRLDQKTRKIKRTTVIDHGFAPPLIKDQSVVFSDGTVIPLI
jgi:hypothetical protein